ncbi:MAG TPA: hypothetical protein VMM58_12575 [Bacteroidota bacterium]|nr:hypothetical protein [Bacteroidota bacterium]
MTASRRLLLAKMKDEKRCPLCALVQEEEFSLLSKLQYNVSQSERVRRGIPYGGGFCDFHFRQFRKIANNRTNAVLLLSFIGYVEQHKSPPSIRCRLCATLSSYEKQMVLAMVDILKDQGQRDLYSKSAGLCFPHAETVLRLLKPLPLKRWLKGMQKQQLLREIPALESLASKSYYNTSGEERGAIPRVSEKFVGRKAIGL